MSVFGYFARSSLIRLATYGVGVASVFIVTPHILRCLSTPVYGVWTLISSLAGYYLLLDCGLLAAVSQKTSAARARGDAAAIERIYTSATCLGIAGFSVVVLIGTALALLSRFFSIETVDAAVIGVSIFIFSTTFGIDVLMRPAQGMLAGAMRWTYLALISMMRVLLSSCAVLFLLREDLSPPENLLRMACITGMMNILVPLTYCLTVRFSMRIPFSPGRFSWSEAKDLLRFGASLLASQVGDLLNSRTQVYLAATVVGTADTALFSIARQFINYMRDIVLSAFGIMNPYFSRLHAQKDMHGARQSLLETLSLSYMTACLFGLALVFYSGLFIARWLGPEYQRVQEVLIPLSLAAILWCGETPANGFLIGIGQQRILAVLTVAQGILITLLCYPAVLFQGLSGVGWMVLAVNVFFCLGIKPYQISRFSGLRPRSYYAFLIAAIIPQIFAQTVYYLAVRPLLAAEYWRLFLAGCGQTIVAVLALLASLKWLGRFPAWHASSLSRTKSR